MGWVVGIGAVSVTLIGFAVLAVLSGWTASAATLDMDSVERTIRDRVERGLTPGMIIAVVDKDGATYFAHGHTTPGGAPVDADTVFEIGSITKAFVGILLASMAEDGLVELDAPLAECLPEGTVVPSLDGENITLLHLATHTSGLPRMPANFDPANPANPYADYDSDALLDALAGSTLSGKPGARHEYSNFGTALLGYALAHVAGQDFESLMRARVLEPLGLTDTAIVLPESMRARMATGHIGTEPTSQWDFDAFAGAGALRSTARDMVRFLEANLGITETPLREALDTAATARTDADTPDTRVGLGWHISGTPGGREAVWHNGGTGGFRTIVGFDRDAGRGVVVLANSSVEVTDDIGMHLADPRAPLATMTPRTEIELAPSAMEPFTGQYELQPGMVFDIELRDGTLHARLTDQGWLPIYPEAPDRFFYKAVDAQLVFQRDDEGAVTGVTLHQGGMQQTAPRLSPSP